MQMKNGLWAAVIVLAMVAGGCNGSRSDAVKLGETPDHHGFVKKTLPNGRQYCVFLPMNYTPSRKWPAIMFLHGVGEAGSSMDGPLRVGLAPFACDQRKDFPFIVIIPQSRGGWGADSDDARDAIAALEQAKHDYAIDPDRVSLTGLSTGGYGTFAIGAKYHDEFAALAPMCPSGADASDGEQLGKMHIWAFENAADPFVAPMSMAITLGSIKNNGGTVKHTVYPAVGHDCWETAYSQGELFNWLQQQRRPGSVATASHSVAPKPYMAPVSKPVASAPPAHTSSTVISQRPVHAAPVSSPTRSSYMPETPY